MTGSQFPFLAKTALHLAVQFHPCWSGSPAVLHTGPVASQASPLFALVGVEGGGLMSPVLGLVTSGRSGCVVLACVLEVACGG